MNLREIPAVRAAEEILKRAERTYPSLESSELFREAFQDLNFFLESETRAPEVVQFVTNLKNSYARTIVLHLDDLDRKDFDKYVHYLVVLFLHLDPELESLRASNPDIGKVLDSCKIKFGPQMDELHATLTARGV